MGHSYKLIDLSSDTDAITLFRCGLYFTDHTYLKNDKDLLKDRTLNKIKNYFKFKKIYLILMFTKCMQTLSLC